MGVNHTLLQLRRNSMGHQHDKPVLRCGGVIMIDANIRIVRELMVVLLSLMMVVSVSAEQPNDRSIEINRDIVFAIHGETSLRLDAYIPSGSGPFAGVLVVHGGAWRTGSKSHVSHYGRRLAQSGYAAFMIDYRLAPASQFPAQIEDSRCALRWISSNAEQYRVNTDYVGALGYSAGGHLVALLGATQDIPGFADRDCNCEGSIPFLKAVVAGGAPCDFRQLPLNSHYRSYFFGGTRAEKQELYVMASPAAHVSHADPPMLFFHGERDWLVKISQPHNMIKSLKKAGVEASLSVIKGAGHISAAVRKEGMDISVEFFDRHLRIPLNKATSVSLDNPVNVEF